MELDSERFKSLQELSQVQVLLATGRAEFEKLKSSREDYENQVKADTLLLVQEVLLASREALTEADNNRTAIASLLTEAMTFISTVHTMADGLENATKTHTDAVNDFQVRVTDKLSELNTQISDLGKRRRQIEDDENNFKMRDKKLKDGELVYLDRMEMLRKDIVRLGKVQL